MNQRLTNTQQPRKYRHDEPTTKTRRKTGATEKVKTMSHTCITHKPNTTKRTTKTDSEETQKKHAQTTQRANSAPIRHMLAIPTEYQYDYIHGQSHR